MPTFFIFRQFPRPRGENLPPFYLPPLPDGRLKFSETFAVRFARPRLGRPRGGCLSILPILEDIPGLTAERAADRVQRGKADRADFSRLDFGKVDVGDPHLFGKLVQRHFSVRHDAVET